MILLKMIYYFIALKFGILLSCHIFENLVPFLVMFSFLVIFQAVSRGGEEEVPVLFKMFMDTNHLGQKGMRTLP